MWSRVQWFYETSSKMSLILFIHRFLNWRKKLTKSLHPNVHSAVLSPNYKSCLIRNWWHVPHFVYRARLNTVKQTFVKSRHRGRWRRLLYLGDDFSLWYCHPGRLICVMYQVTRFNKKKKLTVFIEWVPTICLCLQINMLDCQLSYKLASICTSQLCWYSAVKNCGL